MTKIADSFQTSGELLIALQDYVAKRDARSLLLRFYDDRRGTEYVASGSITIEDGIVCVDLRKQDGVTPDQA
jgi:hypothetical protein